MVVQTDPDPHPADTGEKKHKLKQRFDVIRKLGQGTYGKVQLAINKETGQEVAIKTIKKSKIESEQDSIRIRREIQIMSSIQHPHIIHIYEVFENKDKIVLVMQNASGGELYDYLSERRQLNDNEARRVFRQVATAVYYCHKNKICHRDLKLENILLDEKGNAKIADFGLSNVYDERHFLSTFCGSPLYASPEIVKGTPYYGPEVDCWSMGVLLYTLVYGAMPFDGSNFKRLVTQISTGDYFEPKKKSEASGLIRHLLTVNPTQRATIVDICTHEWVNRGFDHSLLMLAEDMANLTPVRLDLLLALAPITPPGEMPSRHPLAGVSSSSEAGRSDGASSIADDESEVQSSTDAGSFTFLPAGMTPDASCSFTESPFDESSTPKRDLSKEGSLMRMSSVAHKAKKVKPSPSMGLRISRSLLACDKSNTSEPAMDVPHPLKSEDVQPVLEVVKNNSKLAMTEADLVITEVHKTIQQSASMSQPCSLTPVEEQAPSLTEESRRRSSRSRSATLQPEDVQEAESKETAPTPSSVPTSSEAPTVEVTPKEMNESSPAISKRRNSTKVPKKQKESLRERRLKKSKTASETSSDERTSVAETTSNVEKESIKCEQPQAASNLLSEQNANQQQMPTDNVKDNNTQCKNANQESEKLQTIVDPTATLSDQSHSEESNKSTEEKFKVSVAASRRRSVPLPRRGSGIGKIIIPKCLESSSTTSTPSPKVSENKRVIVPTRSVSDAKKAFEARQQSREHTPASPKSTSKSSSPCTPPVTACSKISPLAVVTNPVSSTETEAISSVALTNQQSSNDKSHELVSSTPVSSTEVVNEPSTRGLVPTQSVTTVQLSKPATVRSSTVSTMKSASSSSSSTTASGTARKTPVRLTKLVSPPRQIITCGLRNEDKTASVAAALTMISPEPPARAKPVETKVESEESVQEKANVIENLNKELTPSVAPCPSELLLHAKPEPIGEGLIGVAKCEAKVSNPPAPQMALVSPDILPNLKIMNEAQKAAASDLYQNGDSSLTRMSPEGSEEDVQRRVVSPGGRSYKKFTFSKDGTCVTEHSRIYQEPQPDGSWATVEKRTKIIRRPGSVSAEQQTLVPGEHHPEPDDDSEDSADDIFQDMFPFGSLMKMKSSFKRPGHNQRRRAREWSVDRNNSTDRDSSDNEDDFDLHLDNSTPVGLMQFMSSMDHDFRNRWRDFPLFSRHRFQSPAMLKMFLDKRRTAAANDPASVMRRPTSKPPTPSAFRSDGEPGLWSRGPSPASSIYGTLRHKPNLSRPPSVMERASSVEREAGLWSRQENMSEPPRHRIESWLHTNEPSDLGHPKNLPRFGRLDSEPLPSGLIRNEVHIPPLASTRLAFKPPPISQPGTPPMPPRPLVKMQVSIGSPNAQYVIRPGFNDGLWQQRIATPPPAGGLPRSDSRPFGTSSPAQEPPPTQDISLLEALKNQGLRSLLTQREQAKARLQQQVLMDQNIESQLLGSVQSEVPQTCVVTQSNALPNGEPRDASSVTLEDSNNNNINEDSGSVQPDPVTPTNPIDTSNAREVLKVTIATLQEALNNSNNNLLKEDSPSSPSAVNGDSESVRDRIHRKSFYAKYNDQPQRRKSGLWEHQTSIPGAGSTSLWDSDMGSPHLRKSRSLWGAEAGLRSEPRISKPGGGIRIVTTTTPSGGFRTTSTVLVNGENGPEYRAVPAEYHRASSLDYQRPMAAPLTEIVPPSGLIWPSSANRRSTYLTERPEEEDSAVKYASHHQQPQPQQATVQQPFQETDF